MCRSSVLSSQHIDQTLQVIVKRIAMEFVYSCLCFEDMLISALRETVDSDLSSFILRLCHAIAPRGITTVVMFVSVLGFAHAFFGRHMCAAET